MDNLPSGEPGQGTKQEQGRLKWSVCSLTGEPLRAPIVACELGKLYNRTSVIGMHHSPQQQRIYHTPLPSPPPLPPSLLSLSSSHTIIEFLLGEGVFVYTRDELKKNGFGHITSIKNVIELKLTANPTYDPNKSTSNVTTTAKAPGIPPSIQFVELKLISFICDFILLNREICLPSHPIRD